MENIVTTHDELFKAMSGYDSPAAKEVVNYRTALWHGYKLVKENQILTTNMIVEIQGCIEHNQAGIRKLSGTVLKNDTAPFNAFFEKYISYLLYMLKYKDKANEISKGGVNKIDSNILY